MTGIHSFNPLIKVQDMKRSSSLSKESIRLQDLEQPLFTKFYLMCKAFIIRSERGWSVAAPGRTENGSRL